MHDAALDQLEEKIEAVAESSGREDRRAYISGIWSSCCASKTRWPRPSAEPMNISATTTMTRARDAPLRRPTKVCGSDSRRVISNRMRAGDAPATFAAEDDSCGRS